MTHRLGTLLAVLFVFCASTTAKAQSESTRTLLQTQEAARQQPVQPQTAPSQTPAPPKLTLDDAIRTALAEHPILRQARQAIVAAEARTKQAKSAYFPQTTASGIAKQGLSGASGALSLRGLVTSPLFRDIGASSAAFQNLYDFGRTSHQVKASKWAAVSLNHALEAEQAFVVLDVQQAYYTTLQQQRLVTVDEKILADRPLIARQAAAFYNAQIRSKVDVSLAEVGVSNANLELVQARDHLRTAFAELNRAIGTDGAPVYALEEMKITIESPPALEPLIDEGQQKRSDLVASTRADQAFAS